jgi:histidine triad (HIT) family protein
MDCIFCMIKDGKIPSEKVWEDENFFAFLDINPVNPGHTLIIPKKHEDYIFELDGAEYAALFNAAKTVAGPLKKATGAKRIGMLIEGFLVHHAHLHLIPINRGSEMAPGNAKKATPEELKAMGAKIRAAF